MMAARGSARVDDSTVGPIGQRYLEVNFGGTDEQGIAKAALNEGATLQIPAMPHLDIGLGYAHSHLNRSLADGFFTESRESNSAIASVTVYTRWAGLRPFVGAGAYRQWQRQQLTFGSIQIFHQRTDHDYWATNIGAEIPLGRIVLTPKIGYVDRFHYDSSWEIRTNSLIYSADAHIWWTKRWGSFVTVDYIDPQTKLPYFDFSNGNTTTQQQPFQWQYATGIRLRF